MTWWTDRLGYEGREMHCTTPPPWMRVSDIVSRGPGGRSACRELDRDTLLETAEYMLTGHSLRETAEHFGLSPDAVKHRMRTAGYSYNAADGRWGIW